MENSYKPVTKLSRKDKKTMMEVAYDAELDFFVLYDLFVTKEITTLFLRYLHPS